MNTGIESMDQAAIDEFVALADEYCEFIENRANLEPEAFIRRAAHVLPRLYAAGSQLPLVDFDEDKLESDAVSREEHREITKSIDGKLGNAATYWDVFDPYEREEPVANTLGDDLADIYRDLKNNLVLYRQGTRLAILSAVWEWRFGFAVHWGKHLTGAMRAVHQILTDRGLE
jgi:hypothetical protein